MVAGQLRFLTADQSNSTISIYNINLEKLTSRESRTQIQMLFILKSFHQKPTDKRKFFWNFVTWYLDTLLCIKYNAQHTNVLSI